MSDKTFFTVLLTLYAMVLVWSGIMPKEYGTWAMEVAPSVIILIVLLLTHKRFRFSRPVYVLFLIHAAILCIGGKYTYAENPLFEYLKPVFGWERNNYDKVGHLVQGLIPAFAIREYILRTKIILRVGWANFFTVCAIALVTVTYEFIEWWAALLIGQSADAFLGTQGYIWDTQSDMLLAVVGGLVTCYLLGGVHDRWIAREQRSSSKHP